MTRAGLIRIVLSFFKKQIEADSFEMIHVSIDKSVILRCTSQWILDFRTVVYANGQYRNSPASRFGAMLISSLNCPIRGWEYSLITYSYYLFKNANKKLGPPAGICKKALVMCLTMRGGILFKSNPVQLSLVLK